MAKSAIEKAKEAAQKANPAFATKTAAQAIAEFDDFDDSLFTGMKEDAEAFVESVKNSGGDFNTLMYVGEGDHVLRLWPEVFMGVDKDGNPKKQLRVVRIIRTHTIPGVGRIPCEGENCRFCAETKKLYDIKFKDAFKTARKEEGVLTGYLYQSSDSDSKYIKLNTPAYMVIRKRMLIELEKWLGTLDIEDLRKVFNPTNKAPGIKMSLTGGNNGNASIGFTIKEYELPELPETFESGGMGKVFYDDADPDYADDEDLHKYRKYVASIVAGKMNLADPDPEGTETDEESGKKPAANKSAAKEKAAAAVADALKEEETKKPEKAKPVEKAAEKAAPATEAKKGNLPECPGKAADASLDFGKYDADNTECIVCPFEDKCMRYTAKMTGK